MRCGARSTRGWRSSCSSTRHSYRITSSERGVGCVGRTQGPVRSIRRAAALRLRGARCAPPHGGALSAPVSTENRVLIVEDEAAAAEALALHVGRVPGSAVVGPRPRGAEALRRVAAGGVGPRPARHLPARHVRVEALRRCAPPGGPSTSSPPPRARDLSVVQAAVSFGVTQYLVKPFTSTAVRQKLERYSAYRASLAGAGLPVAQGEIDSLFGALRETDRGERAAQGDQHGVLQTVVAGLRPALERDATGAHPARGRGRGCPSAAELAGGAGHVPGDHPPLPRVPRRRRPRPPPGPLRRHGAPELEYRWLPDPHHNARPTCADPGGCKCSAQGGRCGRCSEEPHSLHRSGAGGDMGDDAGRACAATPRTRRRSPRLEPRDTSCSPIQAAVILVVLLGAGVAASPTPPPPTPTPPRTRCSASPAASPRARRSHRRWPHRPRRGRCSRWPSGSAATPARTSSSS